MHFVRPGEEVREPLPLFVVGNRSVRTVHHVTDGGVYEINVPLRIEAEASECFLAIVW